MVIWMLVGAAFAQDADGDGVPDRVEDVNGDGNPANDDTDGDGIPDYHDLDDDNDGVVTVLEGSGDADGDGRPNHRDPDDDNDGIPTSREDALGDLDGDGIPNYFDADDDGDGLPTRNEDLDRNGRPLDDDSDADGTPNCWDPDDDGDGLPTLTELQLGTDWLNVDTDGGGVPDGDEVASGRDPLDPADDLPSPLVVTPPAPGVAGQANVWTVTGAYPGQWIAVVGATRQGRTQLPGCPGVSADLQAPQLVSFGQANASGVMTVGIQVPAGLSGVGVWFQAVSPPACEVSAPVHATFQ